MLDRETKDVDASIELLEDRIKIWKIFFWIMFTIGWAIIWFSAMILPYAYDDIGFGVGIALLIFATWAFNNWNYLNTLLMIKKHLT